MSRYIDADALAQQVCVKLCTASNCSNVLKMIHDVPTADVVEVKHGEWEVTDAYPQRVYCGVCYKTYLRNKKWIDELGVPMNYCPNCGAKMNERREDDER